jgi:apolipoprotein N-acyltransferase
MQSILIASIGGILMGMSAAPLGAWYLAWLALIPLWIFVTQDQRMGFPVQADKAKLARIFNQKTAIALAWGCGYHGLALFWITGIHPMTWMGVPWLASLAIATFCWIFITLWGAGLVVAWSVIFSNINRLKIKTNSLLLDSLLRVLIGVAIWCFLEWVWSLGDLWWTSLAYTQSPHNLIILQLGKLSGPSTITASLVAVNGLVAEVLGLLLIKKRAINKKILTFLLLPFCLFISLHEIGFWLYQNPVYNANEGAIKVGIIQGNIPNTIKLYPEGWRKAIEGYTTGYKTLSDRGVDIVLTPETALPFFWDDLESNSSFYAAILEKHVPAWIGAFGRQGKSFTNSLLTVTGTGRVFSRYDKVKLVPLGEYIPFENILGGLIERLSPLDAHLVAGQPHQKFDTPFGRAIVGICYDSAFAEHFRRQAARGGEFIITASNNAHYSAAMPAQHHAQDVMRAIETDRWAARATNTGYSAIVDPRGRTIWISGINTYELHADTIYRRRTRTLYVQWGDWLTGALSLLALLSPIVIRLGNFEG